MEELNAVTLDCLNDDCLLHIFHFLSFRDLIRIERVCKRWRTISLMAWRKLKKVSISNKHFSEKYLQLEHLEKIFERCKNYVTYLDLDKDLDYLPVNDMFKMIDKKCKKIMHLEVGELDVTDKELNVRNFPFLKKLRVFDGCLFTVNLEELTMNAIMTFLENTELEEFDLSNTTEGRIYIEEEGIKIHVSGIEMDPIEDLDLDRLFKRFSKVEDLTLVTVPQFRMYDHLASISTQLKSLVAANNWHDFLEGTKYERLQLTNLRELDLSYNSCINDDVILTFVKKCPLLKEIDFGGCKHVSNTGFRHLIHLKELLVLKVNHSEITSETLQYIGAHCSKLQKIYYSYYGNLNDDELTNIVSLLPDLSYIMLNSIKNLTKKCVKSILESVQQRINGVKLKIDLTGGDAEDAEKLSLRRKDHSSSELNTCLTIVLKEWVQYGSNSRGTRPVDYFYSD